jgi:hypothetical protein
MAISPIKAIRRHCLDCSAYILKEVRECYIPDCPLYPFRMGHNPNIKKGMRKGNPEALKRAREKRSSN